MERLAHGAAVLLHAGGLRRRDAKRMDHARRVEMEEASRRGAGRDRAKRAGQVPAAGVMAGCRLPDADARLEARRISADEIAPAHAAGMQHDAAHVGVVIVEHVTHLAVGERGLHQPELALAAKHARLRLAADRSEHGQKLVDGRMAVAGERAADPVDQAASRLVDGALGEVLEAEARQELAEHLGGVEARRGEIVVGLGGDL
jgi:hypothetical protein